MPIELFIRKLYNIKFYVLKYKLSKKLKLDVVLLNPHFLKNSINLLKIVYFFSCIVDILCIDWPKKSNRFELVYNFLSLFYNLRIYIIVNIAEETVFNNQSFFLKSITNLFYGANWLERETWDMFGVLFFDHPDLRRILTDYGFDGFPLRKDFPLTGFLELRYDEEQKSILYEKVELTQEFRFFDFESPWKPQQ